MVTRFMVFAVLTVALATSGAAQGNSLREKMNSAGDRACVLATHLHQLCSTLQSARTRRSMELLMGAVCKPERAAQRVAIERRTYAVFGQGRDMRSCSARADAFQRAGAEMRSIGIAVEKSQRAIESPSS